MTNTTFNTQEELATFILSEVKKASKRASYTSTFNFDASDLESYLVVRAYDYISNHPQYASESGVRKFIKTRTIDFLKSPNNVHTEVDPFSYLSASDDEGNESDFESTFMSDSTIFADDSTNGMLTASFIEVLSEKDRAILALKVDGYDNKEIAEILGVHRNTVRNTLNKIKELALDFGLEEM